MIYYNLTDQGFKASPRASVGIYNVSMQMAQRVARELPSTFLVNEAFGVPEELKDAPIRSVKADANGFRRVAWDQWRLYAAVKADPSDWVFLPKGFSSFVRKPPCKLAVYIHDVVYAYWRQYYPGYRSQRLHRYFDWALKASLRNASVIFTNSEFTAGELRRFAAQAGLVDLPPIRCAGIGFDHLLTAPCEQERNGILLYVSTWPHKASRALLEKMKRWQEETGFSETVYLVGPYPTDIGRPAFSNWRIMETLPEPEYREILGRVRCSVFNSAYEGFGMPPGEALFHGAVPVYSSIPVLREVMDGAGFPYNNADYRSFADSMQSALSVQGDALAGWKSDFLQRHNWAKVLGVVKPILE